VCLEYQNGFYELLTNPKMKANWPSLEKRGPWRWPLDLMCLVCPVPNTYVGMQSCIQAMMWWWCFGSANSYLNEVLGSTPQTWLNGLALSHVLHLTLSGAPKILLYCMEYRRPTTAILKFRCIVPTWTFAIFIWVCNFHMSLQFSYQFEILMSRLQCLLTLLCMGSMSLWPRVH
jgi:hypothetical protein